MVLSEYFWWTNALNILDAALTIALVRRGLAFEANPVVTTIGWQGKFAVVLGASLALDFLRPKALLVPIAALSAVVLYSGIGLISHI